MPLSFARAASILGVERGETNEIEVVRIDSETGDQTLFAAIQPPPATDDEIRIVVENPVNHIRIDHLPPTDRMLAACDGALWMERSDLDAEPWVRELRHIVRTIVEQPNTVWDIFDSSGRYRATVELPAKFRPGQVAVDWIVGVQPDELDVEYVVRYRIKEGQ